VDQTDGRGNTQRVPDESNAIELRAHVQHVGSGAAGDLAGQVSGTVLRVAVSEDPPSGFDAYSSVIFEGKTFDVISPVTYHHGTRHVRRWAFDVRSRQGASS
jgi:hypothetical protein